jgi:hypothetical protein
MDDHCEQFQGKTLILNTANEQRITSLFASKIGSTIETPVVYDVGIIQDSPIVTEKKIRGNCFSYFKLLKKENPQNILIVFNNSCSILFYLQLFVFLVSVCLSKKNVYIFSDKGNLTKFEDLFPIVFPFAPIFLLKKIPKIFSTYLRCILSSENNGYIKGFNQNYAPVSFWYETQGKKILNSGCWGYSNINHFGESLREKFYHHFLSYGLLLNTLGFRAFHVLAGALFVSSVIVVSFLEYNSPVDLFIPFFLIISPLFLFSFIVYTKPENVSWFLCVPAFYCILHGNLVGLALIVLISAYLSFTVFFLIAATAFGFIIISGNHFLAVAFIPAFIKLGIDGYPLLRSNYLTQLLLIISGKKISNVGSVDQRSIAHRKYGLILIPINYFYILGFAFLLFFLQLWNHEMTMIMTGVFIFIFFVNFFLVRLMDPQTLYRFYLCVVLIAAISSNILVIQIFSLLLLMINPILVDDLKIMKQKPFKNIFPPVKIVEWSNEQERQIASVINKIPSGSRVLFQYSGHIIGSPFRNILSILEAKIFDRNSELIPDELFFYTNPQFVFDYACNLSPDGDLIHNKRIMQELSISHALVFSEALKDNLVKIGFECQAELDLSIFKGFVHEKNIPSGKLFLLDSRCHFPYCNDPSVQVVLGKNTVLLRNVLPGKDYLINMRYHPTWQAYQSSKKIVIEPTDIFGITCMKITSLSTDPIKFQFGFFNFFIR